MALALIEEYNNGDGTTVLTKTTATNKTVLTKADYEAVGVTGVSDQAVASGVEGTDNLAAVNAQVLLSNPGEANSVAKIQGLVSFGNQAIAYVTTAIQPLTTAPAANNVGENEVSVDDQLAAYAAAGITGVSADNLLAVNAQLRLETTATNKDSVSDIEAIVTKANDAITYLTTTIQPLTTAPADGAETGGEISVDDQLAAYAAAGITGVSADNLLAVNAQLRLETTATNKDSVSDIQAIVTKANTALALIEEYNNGDGTTVLTNTTATNQTVLTKADYEAVGITGVSDTTVDAGTSTDGTDNLAAVNAQVLLSDQGEANTVAKIQSLVSAGNDAITYLTTTTQPLTTAPADGTETGGEISVDDQLAAYAAAGITGVSADNLLAVNAQLRLETTATDKDSVSDIEAIVTKANDAIAYLTTTIQPLTTAPADGAETGGEISVDDQLAAYAAAGITGVSADNLLAVNAQLRLETTATNKDSVSDIQAIVTKANTALALIEEYNKATVLPF
jgi:TusA-related sulfurtransferase